MSRHTRGREERRREFIDVSHALFNEKGFENTSIDDIVEAMDVAKGLFYYYFKTKDDVLYCIVDKMLDEVTLEVEGIMRLECDSTIRRTVMLLRPYARLGGRTQSLLSCFKHTRNQEFYNYFLRKAKMILHPALASTIEKGIDEGIFNVDFVHETAEMMMSIGNATYRNPVNSDPDIRIEVMFNIGGRLLGMDPALFNQYDKLVLNDMMTRY